MALFPEISPHRDAFAGALDMRARQPQYAKAASKPSYSS
jgi:hypothetical protein